ncbi:RNA polymerase II subunit A C-terminal domain phosphatase-like isoform X2 [Varroa jacobsoni]|uniref:RNA polymerase II subunit A C-terminal domain phosphatase n=1 Tax=Varroa destructor TaxID=109461 RepID=A0A7M7KAG8_VARDE|nr:RNA polymerase II subunit A C-terminal domain phosphatase-like isoform X2 [Varroa destructor]XP_022685854.1 RNA polymerase II subunit A C-terminal domain phosphatase-like isoform X2 [Varroa jacobsoni]
MEPATASVELNGDRLFLKTQGPIKVLRLKVKPEFRLYKGFCLLTFEESQALTPSGPRPRSLNLKCPFEGIVSRVLVSAGAVIENGSVLLELKRCAHPIVMKDLCAECGADLRELEAGEAGDASVSMIHAIPELRINEQLSQSIGKADEQRLLGLRKLVLLVDLDQTLVHTTSEMIHPKLKGVEHFTLPGNRQLWYHTRIRPGTERFLEKISRLFELHIVTFGARPYAHHIASLLDKQKKYFQFRILSRDECFHPASKTANLRSLFPCGDQLVAIIDDREDVWNFAANLVTVKPYVFFRGAGDINAPIGGLAEFHSLPPSDGGSCSAFLSPRNPVVIHSDRDVVACLRDLIEHSCAQVDGFVEYDDADDYLLYLEDILTTIHRAFFELYEQMQSQPGSSDSNTASSQVGNGSSGAAGRPSRIPDLKTVIPYVRQKVLKDVVLVFTGCLPTNQRPEVAKIYQVAVALGARVHKDLSKEVTHLVAARPGTAKLVHARKLRNIKVVATQWLWCCAERWEHVSEKLFPLKDAAPEEPLSGRRRNRLGRPLGPILSPEERQQVEQEAREMSELDRLAGEQQAVLPESFVPSLAIGLEGLAEMGKEVDDELDDDDDDDDENVDDADSNKDEDSRLVTPPAKRRRQQQDENDEEEEDALYGEDNSAPRGWAGKDDDGGIEEDFGGRRTLDWPDHENGVDFGDEEWDSDGESVGEVDEEMAAAVERELFS